MGPIWGSLLFGPIWPHLGPFGGMLGLLMLSGAFVCLCGALGFIFSFDFQSVVCVVVPFGDFGGRFGTVVGFGGELFGATKNSEETQFVINPQFKRILAIVCHPETYPKLSPP